MTKSRPLRRLSQLTLGVLLLVVPPTGYDAQASSVDQVRVEPLAVASSDGTVLRGHVYLPPRSGQFATVLEMSPYWGTNYPRSGELLVTAEGDPTLRDWLGPFFDAGFAVAAVNVRGTDQSGGCLQWGTRQDALDAAAVIEALAAKDWSNGSVGMTGHSYPAWLAYLALTEAPPALDAIAIASGIIDPWNLMTRHGAAMVLSPSIPAVSAALTTGALGLAGQGGADALTQMPPEHVVCPQYATDAAPYPELLVSGDRTHYWKSVDLRSRIAGTEIPVLVANGLQQEGHILQVDGLWPLLGGRGRMLLGQWNHQWPHRAGHEGWQRMMVDWFDQHLRGEHQVVQPGVVEYQDDAGTWHRSDQWPPQTRSVVLPLGDGVLLGVGQSAGVSKQAFQSTDYDPVPADCPTRQALWVSPPLAEDVVLAGHFELDLTLTSTEPDGNLAAFVFHRDDLAACPDPQVPFSDPLTNYLYAPYEVRRALTDLRHAGGREQGRDFPIASPEAITLTSHPFASRVRAGERLILAVSGGAKELWADVYKPVLTVSTGPGLAGELRLPVLEGEVAFRAA